MKVGVSSKKYAKTYIYKKHQTEDFFGITDTTFFWHKWTIEPRTKLLAFIDKGSIKKCFDAFEYCYPIGVRIQVEPVNFSEADEPWFNKYDFHCFYRWCTRSGQELDIGPGTNPYGWLKAEKDFKQCDNFNLKRGANPMLVDTYFSFKKWYKAQKTPPDQVSIHNDAVMWNAVLGPEHFPMFNMVFKSGDPTCFTVTPTFMKYHLTYYIKWSSDRLYNFTEAPNLMEQEIEGCEALTIPEEEVKIPVSQKKITAINKKMNKLSIK